ncbi:uncharacterized protein LOC103703282 isoform X2 [Phoenix dactylifera]|uniref:Uncharacterized protein LOC103703282 isoform X2 n=1 Tax=Phoenix dactylifera TaxID=42345 RepID=A0A8B9AL30_PHODC|nr:uncharacterized protein LOC103703282 isoform X2 [Phoenix dactylifera]
MDKNEDSGSPGWGSSFFMQTTEDVARAFFAAASAATVRSTRPSAVFSSRDDNSNSQLQKLQSQVTKVLKGFSPPPEVKGAYNPEVLTSQKRQWSRFQLQSLDQRPVKEPSRVFESMVVVGLHPNVDVQALQRLVLERNNEDSKKKRSLLSYNLQVQAEPNLEPQVLFVYPPEKQLPLKNKDLLSFCFPGGVEVHAVERTPSLSELNEILLGQLKQNNQSFVFRLQVADDSTFYGCCVLVDEMVQKPSNLVSMLIGEQSFSPSLSRHIITTSRCYCILSRLPFFELHFGILRSIFIEERFEWLTKGIDMLNLLSLEETSDEDSTYDRTNSPVQEQYCTEDATNLMRCSDLSTEVSTPKKISDNDKPVDNQLHEMNLNSKEVIQSNTTFQVNQEITDFVTEGESRDVIQDNHDNSVDEVMKNRQSERRIPDAVLPLLRCCLYESSESSASIYSFQGSPSEDRNFRSDMDEVELEEPSSSGLEDSSGHGDILEWAKANSHGSLQIICEYYQLHCPARGSKLTFRPLEHLHPLDFHRPGETVLHIADSTVDLRSCNTSLEVAEAHSALLAEEEAIALSVWTIACICGCLRLENIITMFAGALLEKQIVIVCSNLGILSAAVLSVVPLIRPYQWQSLLMPILPNDMLDFLDAPVPYIVGIKNKTADIQPKLANAILIDANKNQVRSPSMPQLPRQRELLSSLGPYHAKLVGESFLARKRPVYECTDVQVEAAKGFLAVLRSYLDSLCSNLRSHTITNVQSNNDKVSLLLKESFIESFPNRDRSFMKLFVDTQLFSVRTDLVLSFYQKD